MTTAISVVVLGYGAEEHLEECLSSIVDQLPAESEIVLVDNGIERGAARSLDWHERVRVIGDGSENTGFAGGCAVGVAATSGEVLVFVNSDAVLRADALSHLVAGLDDPTAGIICGCLRLADEPDLVNSVGNPLQFLGLTWAGECGSPASEHLRAGDVAVATGGLFAITRATWDSLGGFDPTYFAYHEDTDLSVRTWLSGRTVRVEPAAVADHFYEFSRNPRKMYLLERNRFIFVLTTYPDALLLRVLPAVIVLEPAFFVLAVIQGWAPQKVRAWAWLATHGRYLRTRRAHVQSQIRVADPSAVLASLMVPRIDPPNVSPPPGMGLINGALRAYWGIVRPDARRGRRGSIRDR